MSWRSVQPNVKDTGLNLIVVLMSKNTVWRIERIGNKSEEESDDEPSRLIKFNANAKDTGFNLNILPLSRPVQ